MGENDTKCKEISVFLIPDLSGVLPSHDAWKLEWKQRRKESKHRRELSQKLDKVLHLNDLKAILIDFQIFLSNLGISKAQ